MVVPQGILVIQNVAVPRGQPLSVLRRGRFPTGLEMPRVWHSLAVLIAPLQELQDTQHSTNVLDFLLFVECSTVVRGSHEHASSAGVPSLCCGRDFKASEPPHTDLWTWLIQQCFHSAV